MVVSKVSRFFFDGGAFLYFSQVSTYPNPLHVFVNTKMGHVKKKGGLYSFLKDKRAGIL
jgi:hypothetical protein